MPPAVPRQQSQRTSPALLLAPEVDAVVDVVDPARQAMMGGRPLKADDLREREHGADLICLLQHGRLSSLGDRGPLGIHGDAHRLRARQGSVASCAVC